MKEIRDGEDYAQQLTTLLKAELQEGDPTALSKEFVKKLCQEVTKLALKVSDKYEAGKRESKYISQAEFRVLYQKVLKEYTEELVDKLVEDGKCRVSVSKDGELVYEMTEKGRQEGLR